MNRVLAWRPDVVHVTGWAWASHLWALRALHRRGIPTLFRGDSHLLEDMRRGPRWWLKQAVLRQVFAWPSVFLYVGKANRAYYETFGVPTERLHYCPHSVDVARFARPAEPYEREAWAWRRQLGITDDAFVLLFAGKFEPKKRPLELMRAVLDCPIPALLLLLVGNGELDGQVQALARANAARFRVLPFQNQSRMPVVYRLGDLFVLPSGWGETWGLAVNEALACGRPALVSDRVGCAADVLGDGEVTVGEVFSLADPAAMRDAIGRAVILPHGPQSDRSRVLERAWEFDISRTEASLVNAIKGLGRR